MYQGAYLILLHFATFLNIGKVDSFIHTHFKVFSCDKSFVRFNSKSHIVKNKGGDYDDSIIVSQPICSRQDLETNRRNFLKKNYLYLSVFDYIVSTNPNTVNAVESIDNNDVNLNCLLDLPPVEEGYVRVYLCRHGQTEYNRLRLVQGSRIDPPLNENGMEMARRIGLALSKLPFANSPTMTLCSELKRAEETARIASQNMIIEQKVDENAIVLSTPLVRIKDLNEVDFGNLEGMAVNETRTLMTKSFAAWSIGALDKTFMENGENGLQVS